MYDPAAYDALAQPWLLVITGAFVGPIFIAAVIVGVVNFLRRGVIPGPDDT